MPPDVRHLRLAQYLFYGISANNEWLKFDWRKTSNSVLSQERKSEGHTRKGELETFPL